MQSRPRSSAPAATAEPREPRAGGPSGGEPASDREVAALLERIDEGESGAASELLLVLYEDLHRRAEACMRGQRVDHTLQATALVNEAYLRLVGAGGRWNDRAHFLSVAARAMRSILVDHARRKTRDKRTAHGEQVPLDQIVVSYEEGGVNLVDLDSAIARLATFDPRMARAIELRFFGGLSVDETADVLGVTKRMFERNWTVTRAWLRAQVL